MTFVPTAGDTIGPLEFFIKGGPHSPAEQAVNALRRLISGERLFAGLVFEIESLLQDVDAGHSKLQQLFSGNSDVDTMMRQWAIVSVPLQEMVEELRAATFLSLEEQRRDHFARAANLYDILNTRFMTLVRNGAVNLLPV